MQGYIYLSYPFFCALRKTLSYRHYERLPLIIQFSTVGRCKDYSPENSSV